MKTQSNNSSTGSVLIGSTGTFGQEETDTIRK